METKPLPQSPSQPLSKKGPVKYLKTKSIDTQNLKKYRVYRFKNLKVKDPPLAISETYKRNSRTIRPSKSLEKQGFLSSTSYCLNNRTAFENSYFASRIKAKSSSLTSFRLDAANKIQKTPRTFFKSLTSLKNLQDFHIYILLCEFPAINSLHFLFRCLSYLKSLKDFSLHKFACKGFEERHLKTLCLSLSRSSQLQSLKLYLDDSNNFPKLFIPLLSKLTSLTKIHFSIAGSSSIQAEKILQLFQTLSGIKTITDISLNFDHWTASSEDRALVEALQFLNVSSIRKLDLSFCKGFPTKAFGRISQVVEKLTSLQKLNLNLLNLQGIINEKLSPCLDEFASLTSLSLVFPGFTQNLDVAFKSLQNLIYLKLSFNHAQTSDHQTQQFSLGLRALKSPLKYLEIHFASKSSLSDVMLGEELSFPLQKLTQLKHFSLSLTSAPNITPQGIITLLLAIQKLSILSSVNLDFANTQGFDGKALDAFSQALKNLPRLQSIALDLSQCNKIDPRGSFQNFYDILDEKKNLYCLRLKLPFYHDPSEAIAKLSKRLELRVSENSDHFEIMTL